MKTVLKIMTVTIVAGLSIFLAGCAKQVGITATINWADETYFTESGDWYAAAVVGLYSIVSGLENEPFEYVEVTPGSTEMVQFTGEATGYENFTVLIFLDTDENGRYDADEDILTGYKYGTTEPGVELELDVNAYY